MNFNWWFDLLAGWWFLLLIAAGSLILVVWLVRRPHGTSPLTSLGYTKPWELLGNKNIISLIIGVILSGLLMLATAVLLMFLADLILPATRPGIATLLVGLIGILLTAHTAYTFFLAGRFTVRPGQTAFISFLNIPMTEMQVGDAWIIPRLMQYELQDSQAFVATTAPETFITGNGVNVTAQVSATPHVKDPLKFKKLRAQDVQPLVSRQLSGKTRAYVADQTVDLGQVVNLENLPADQQWQFVQTITAFKGELVKNGPEAIRIALNRDLDDYGLEVEEGQVQVNQVSLPAQIEEAIDRIFKEIFEKVGISNDARNKAAVAKIFNQVFTENGIKLEELGAEERIDIIHQNLDRALANEDKAKIQAWHSRGRGAAGVMPVITPNGNP